MRACLTSLLTLAPLLGLTSEARAHIGDEIYPSGLPRRLTRSGPERGGIGDRETWTGQSPRPRPLNRRSSEKEPPAKRWPAIRLRAVETERRPTRGGAVWAARSLSGGEALALSKPQGGVVSHTSTRRNVRRTRYQWREDYGEGQSGISAQGPIQR